MGPGRGRDQFPPADRAEHARRDPSARRGDLARGGGDVLPRARRRAPRGDRRGRARGRLCHHRRVARRTRRRAGRPGLEQHRGGRRRRRRSSPATTRRISCRSANTCRSAMCCRSRRSPPARIDLSAGPGRGRSPLPGLPAFAPLICYEAIFPGAIVDQRGAPGLDPERHRTMPGTGAARARTSISRSPAPARSRKGCRWSASPITASAASSTPTGGCSRASASTRSAMPMSRCPAAASAAALRPRRRLDFLGYAVARRTACVAPSAARR